MLREAAIEIAAAATWAPEHRHGAQGDWHAVDLALRTIARRRAGLDADEARWLREAEALQIWRPLGMVSALDYMERVLGYGPRTAQERLRVARALGALPQLTTALAQGELPFSAVRELTRVATPATEAAWCEAAAGKNLRQIEEIVADHRPGDRPDDPGDPEARTHVVRFELSAETFGLLRQARTVLDDEHRSHLSDDEAIAALCGAVLDAAPTTEPTGRAKFQIAVTVCERCGQGWQDGAGARIAISPAVVERATCDAQHIGSIDGATPERAHQDVPPSVARLVWRRDGGRCRVPGCRSSRGLEIHHLVRRVDGGGHDASNLMLACSSCHQAHHAGAVMITGTAANIEVRRPAESRSIAARAGAHVDAVANANAPGTAGAHVDAVANANASGTAGVHVDAVAIASASATAGAPVDAAAGALVDAVANANSSARAGAHVDALSKANASPMAGAHVDAPTMLDVGVLRTQAKDALTKLGWKPVIAQAAVATALTALGAETTVERLIFDALRRCPQRTR